MRWCVRLWQTCPCMKWQTNANSHKSSTANGFFSLHQRLAFPSVWVSAMHRTDVPVPAQLSQLPRGVKVRLHHEKIVVWQSPSIGTARLPWGASMGSYKFSHGCPPEHPLRMGEDFRWKWEVDVYTITCIWQGDRHLQPIDAIGQWTEWLPQLLTELSHSCKTIGGMEWVSTPLCQAFDDSWSSTLMWNTPTQSKREPCHQKKGGFIPSLHQARRNINTSNSTKPKNGR